MGLVSTVDGDDAPRSPLAAAILETMAQPLRGPMAAAARQLLDQQPLSQPGALVGALNRAAVATRASKGRRGAACSVFDRAW